METLIMILTIIALLILIIGDGVFAFQTIQDYLEEKKH